MKDANRIQYRCDPSAAEIYLTDVRDRSILAEMPEKVRELAELLGMEPDLFPKNVPS